MTSDHHQPVVGATAKSWETAARRSARPTGRGQDWPAGAGQPAMVESLERSIAAQPMRALLVAFGAGLFLGKLL